LEVGNLIDENLVRVVSNKVNSLLWFDK
jgi:hypothetical protein